MFRTISSVCDKAREIEMKRERKPELCTQLANFHYRCECIACILIANHVILCQSSKSTETQNEKQEKLMPNDTARHLHLHHRHYHLIFWVQKFKCHLTFLNLTDLKHLIELFTSSVPSVHLLSEDRIWLNICCQWKWIGVYEFWQMRRRKKKFHVPKNKH